VKAGEEQSPLGPLAALAQKQGYSTERKSPQPYLGYYYRILKGQGKDAPGGAYDYMVKGNMIGGFALVAYPAKYGSSGIMTFIVNHDGVVYQKDLGGTRRRRLSHETLQSGQHMEEGGGEGSQSKAVELREEDRYSRNRPAAA